MALIIDMKMRLNLFFLVPFLIVLIACNDSKELEGVNVQKKQNTVPVRRTAYTEKHPYFLPLKFTKHRNHSTPNFIA